MKHREDVRHSGRTGEMRVMHAADDSCIGNPYQYMASHEGGCVSFLTLKLWRESFELCLGRVVAPLDAWHHVTHTHALPATLRQPRLWSPEKKKSERGEKKSKRVKETGSQCMCVTVSELTVRHNYGRLVKPHWKLELEPSGPRDNDLWDWSSHTSHTHTSLERSSRKGGVKWKKFWVSTHLSLARKFQAFLVCQQDHQFMNPEVSQSSNMNNISEAMTTHQGHCDES